VNSELSDSIRAITQDKGISSELVQKVVEEFLLAAYKKTYGTSDNAVVKFGDDLGEVTISAKKGLTTVRPYRNNIETYALHRFGKLRHRRDHLYRQDAEAYAPAFYRRSGIASDSRFWT
jgi:hypothetical protein